MKRSLPAILYSYFIIFLLLIIITRPQSNYAQAPENLLRTKTITVSSDTVRLDSLSLVPGSLILKDSTGIFLSDSLYIVNYDSGFIILTASMKNTSLNALYRVFPISFSAPYFHRDVKYLLSYNKYKSGIDYGTSYESYSSLNDFKGSSLNQSGNIARGFTFGNNQDVIVNSNLNLQLSGNLTDNLNVVAAISDNNIPIQPDGYSQQLNEFDKVYIKLYNSRVTAIVGDFEMQRPTGYFMNYYKKAQGGYLSANFKLGKNKDTEFRTSIGGAVSKGTYNKLQLSIREGDQGPYMLTGANNELYIVILAGTEKVYMDGELLNRGENNDYVIDYNTAQLTFTTKRIITKDKRVVVEFEYSDKNYSRYLITNSNELITKKSRYWVNIFSESDNNNQPLQLSLDNEEKLFLSGIGDSLDQAIVPGVDSMLFDKNQVLYKRIVRIIDGDTVDVYQYSTSADSAFYKLSFSYVGNGNGDYLPVTSSANGRVYGFSDRVGGQKTGSYEPVFKLVTPKKTQMITVGTEQHWSKNSSISCEFAVSNYDMNTYSDLDSDDDIGYALNLGVNQRIPFNDSLKRDLTIDLKYEMVQKYFHPIERYRTIEFARDWNVSITEQQLNENILSLGLNYRSRERLNTVYSLEYYNKGGDIMNAYRNGLALNYSYKGFVAAIRGNLLKSEDLVNRSVFGRYRVDVSQELKITRIGILNEMESNEWRNLASDSLHAPSFYFMTYGAYLANPVRFKNSYLVSYVHRIDKLPMLTENTMKNVSSSDDVNFNFMISTIKNNSLGFTLTYRKLDVLDSNLTTLEPENTTLARLEHSIRLFKTLITASTFYEVGSGLELKKEYAFVEVTKGQGVYKWDETTDYNHNGIPELNEYELAIFQDEANYIRVFSPTTEYEKVLSNQFSEVINIQPWQAWKNKKGVKKVLSRFSDNFAFRIISKNTENDLWKTVNPFAYMDDTTSLINLTTTLKNTFSFNRSGAVFGVDYIIQSNRNNLLLTYGIDEKKFAIQAVKFRYSPFKFATLTEQIEIGTDSYTSQYFDTKNYSLDILENNLTLSIYPGTSFQMDLNYKYADRANTLQPDTIVNEHATEHNIKANLKYSVAKKGTLQAEINYVKLDYNSDANSSIAYKMLNGLLPGNNGIWSITYQRKLTEGLEISFQYAGRVSEQSGKVIHTGGMQARYIF